VQWIIAEIPFLGFQIIEIYNTATIEEKSSLRPHMSTIARSSVDSMDDPQ